VISAFHDGYQRLAAPLLHRRRLAWGRGNRITVEDSFQGRGSHGFALHFHVHPRASVKQEEGHWRIENGPAKVGMKLVGDAAFSLVQGQTDLPLGWFSPAYGVKEPCTVLVATQTGPAGQVSFKTLIWWD
jgi:hypothetical protein